MPPILMSILIVLLAVVLFVAALMIFRAMVYGRVPPPAQPVDLPAVDGTLVAEHLGAAIQVQTISRSEKERPDPQAFEGMHRALEDMYPRAHAALQRERVNGTNLLYTWQGRAPELEPVLLCAHMDVVPCDPTTRAEWTHPPFAGDVADGFVWGRGALDMKNSVVTILEAVEGLIRAGYQPERTLYLGFGSDEEVGGFQGARCIADLLEERGVRLAAVLDEGAAVMAGGMMPGVSLPVALIGIAEKGYASVELRVEGRPGHSSMPPRHTAIGVLARAIARLEESPLPVRMSMVRLMFQDLGPFMPFATRLALANPILEGAVVKRLLASPTSAALVRTSMAATMINGGVKDNVLPAQVSAVVNCRLMPGDNRAALLAYFRKVINDEAVQVSLDENAGWEPSPVSQVSSPVYNSLSRAIRQVFPEAVVAPYLVAGATDSRHYCGICDNVYRFSPVTMDAELLKTVHGINERVSIETLPRMVAFYHLIIKTWTTAVGNAE